MKAFSHNVLKADSQITSTLSKRQVYHFMAFQYSFWTVVFSLCGSFSCCRPIPSNVLAFLVVCYTRTCLCLCPLCRTLFAPLSVCVFICLWQLFICCDVTGRVWLSYPNASVWLGCSHVGVEIDTGLIWVGLGTVILAAVTWMDTHTHTLKSQTGRGKGVIVGSEQPSLCHHTIVTM